MKNFIKINRALVAKKKVLTLFALLCVSLAGWADASVNVAANQTTKSGWSRLPDTGTSPNANELSGKAVDENTGTQYISYGIGNNSSRAWWAVDLGVEYRLNSINVVWNNGRTPSHYLIQVMTETPSDFVDDVAMSDAGWETVLEVKESQVEGTGGNHYDLGAITARYIRLVPKDRNEIGLNEFEVYADALASEPVTTPTITAATLQSDLSAGSATVTLTATDHNGDALHSFLLKDQAGKVFRVTTDGSDQATLTGLANKRYAFSVWAIEEGCLSASSSSVVIGENTFDPSTNLALNKPAYAVRYQGNTTNTPDKANDGSLTNFWNAGSDSGEGIAAADQDKVWWYVDLQDQYELKSLALFWEGAYANSFIMQVRKDAPTLAQAGDDSAWETFLDYSGNQTSGTNESDINLYGDITGSKAAFAITPKGRYVRFRAKAAQNWGWGVKLREVRIYGSGYLALDNTAPIISEASYNGMTADYLGVKFNVAATDDQTDPVTEFVVVDHNSVSHDVTVDDGVITVTGMPSGKNVDVTIYALDAAGNRSAGTVVNITYLRPDDNLALDKTTNACRNINEGEGHAKAVDNKTNTDWTSWGNANHANDWWYVDLGDFYDIRRIEVVWTANRHSTDYSIQYRQDAPAVDGATESEWKTITEFSGMSGDQAIDITDTQARFICLRSKASYAGDQVRLAEFRVFGKAFAVADNEAPVIAAASYNGVTGDYTGLKFNITASDNVTAVADLVYKVADPDGVEHDATYSEGVITVLGMPTFKNQDITLYVYDAVPNKSTGYVVENVSYVDPNENLALYKTTNACVNLGNNEGPGSAVDGTNHDWTSWNYAHHDNAWWYVDLGDFYDLRRIEVVWTNERHSTNFSIQYRQNAPEVDGATESEWHNFPNCTELNGNQEINITNTQARFICLRSKENYSNNQVRLNEFRVYGKAFAVADDEAPVIAAASYNGTTADYTGLKFNITVSDNVTAVADLVYTVEDPEGVEHDATYSEGVITVLGMPTFKNQEITLYAYDAVPNKSTGYVVENVSYVDPNENLALNKTAYACVHINDGEGRLKPVDGNPSTTWTSYSSAHHDNDWWYVDLGDFYDIRRIEVVWQENRHSTDFSIQYRQNAPEGDSGATEDEWETKYSNLSGDQELDDISGMQARYICMRSKDYIHEQDYAQVRLAEFRVFGKAFATADANPPVITTAFVSYNDDGKAYLNLQATDTEDGVVTTFRVTNVTNSTTETLTTDANNQIVITGLTLNAQYTFEVVAVDNADNHSAVVELKVNIPYTTSTNIAPHGTATAGYNNPGNSGEHADAANDDRTNTAWVTYGCTVPADLWWEVELDGLYHLTKIAVLWNDDNYVTKYTIQTRESNTNDWGSLPQVTIAETGLKETVVDLNARYVRIVVNEQRYDFSRMHEVRVYADAKILSFADDATDNSDLIEANHGQPANVTLNRSFVNDGGWWTLCLPFDMTAEQVTETFGNSTIAQMIGAEDRGSLIHLNFENVNAIEAGVPYLFKPGHDFASGSQISGVTIKNVDPTTAPLKVETAYMNFEGTFNAVQLTSANVRFVGEDNYLYSPAEGGTDMGAFRCYFTVPDGSPVSAPGKRARIVMGEQSTTDIEITNDQSPITNKLLRDGQLLIIRDGRTYNAQGLLIK